MKNRVKLFGIIALIAIMGFMGCDLNGHKNYDPLFSVSGRFDKNAELGGGEVRFKLSAAANSARSVATSNTINGVIEDGDITIRLSGTYDPDTLSYNASAAASIIRYTISGAVDEKGNSLGSTATLLVRGNETSDDWQAFTFIITETAVTITGTPEESLAGGIPAFARGIWNFSEKIIITTVENDQPPVDEEIGTMTIKVMANQWDYIIDQANIYDDESTSHYNNKAAVLEISTISSTVYDIVLSYPVYEATVEQRKASIEAYFMGQNITVLIDSWDGFDNIQGPVVVLFKDGSSSFSGFTDAGWKLLDQYFNTDALRQYLIAQNIDPVTKFEKARIAFSKNNSEMTWMSYYEEKEEEINGMFDTFAEAKALTLFSDGFSITFIR